MVLSTALAVGGVALGSPPAGAADQIASSFEQRPWGQAPCPEGMARSESVYDTSFESGIPWPDFAVGWSAASASTSDGSKVARSIVSPAQSTKGEYFYLPYQQVPPGQHTRLAFASRGTFDAGRGWVTVNSVRETIGGTSSWRGVGLDVTAATRDEDGALGTYFEQRRSSGTARWDVDNVQIFTCRDAATTRIAGSTRYETAAAIAHRYGAGRDVVYVARGDDFPDALSATALAGHEGQPVLLVRPDSIPAETASELDRLDPASIVVVGDEGAVSSGVARQLQQYTEGDVRRLGGATRWATSAAVAGEFSSPERVYVATGRSFPDALSGGALAARDGSPILLVDTDEIPPEIATRLERFSGAEIVVLGGSVAVDDTVVNQLRSYGSVRRVAGEDRYATSALIAEAFGDEPSRSYLATGTGFADALTGGAIAGYQSSPMLLSRPNSIPSPVLDRLTALEEGHGFVVGGQVALASIVRDRYGRTLP